MQRYQTHRFHQRRATTKTLGFGRIEEASLLTTFAVCSILSLGIYLTSFVVDPSAIRKLRWGTPPPHMVIEMHKTPAFQLSGIKLGMTLAEVESVYPEIIFFGKSETGITGKFKLGNGVYNIGFNGPLVGRQAHTIGYRESFWNLSEIELRQRLVSKFGTPAANKCERVNPNLGWQCSLDWKRQDGVGLEAKTRTVNLGNGVRKSELVFVATDPVIKNRFAKKLEESKGKSVRKADKAFKKRMKAISSAARNF